MIEAKKEVEELKRKYREENTKHEYISNKFMESIVKFNLSDIFKSLTFSQKSALKKIFISGFERQSIDLQKVIVKNITIKKIFEELDTCKISAIFHFTKENYKDTWAEIYCEVYGHFFIGIRGSIFSAKAMKHHKENKKKITKIKKYPLIYGW